MAHGQGRIDHTSGRVAQGIGVDVTAARMQQLLVAEAVPSNGETLQPSVGTEPVETEQQPAAHLVAVSRLTRRRRHERFGEAAVVGVDGTDGLAASDGGETLTVRTGHAGSAEPSREWLTLLGIDENSECLTIGFLPQVPAICPGERAVACDVAGVGHAGQYRGEDDAWIVGGQTGVQVRECLAECGPAIHISEYIGDADIGSRTVEPGGEILGGVRRDRLERGDLHLPVPDLHVFQTIRRGLGGNLGQSSIPQNTTFS
jgi:hypothetical protein